MKSKDLTDFGRLSAVSYQQELAKNQLLMADAKLHWIDALGRRLRNPIQPVSGRTPAHALNYYIVLGRPFKTGALKIRVFEKTNLGAKVTLLKELPLRNKVWDCVSSMMNPTL